MAAIRNLRIIQLWLFAIYDKDEIEDLSAKEKRALKGMLDAELQARQ